MDRKFGAYGGRNANSAPYFQIKGLLQHGTHANLSQPKLVSIPCILCTENLFQNHQR